MMVGSSWPLHLDQVGPQQRVAGLAQHALGGEVEQDGAEQRLGDADAAEDEILPGRLEAGRRAVERDQQHGGQRRRLHRHPEDAEVVGGQRHQHGEHEELVHALVEAQARRGEPAVVGLVPHVGAGEDAGGQADEGGQGDEEDVERVDEELLAEGEARAVGDDLDRQADGGEEGAEAGDDVEVGRPGALADHRQQRAADEGNGEHEDEEIHGLSCPSAFPCDGCRGCRTGRGSGRRTRRG